MGLTEATGSGADFSGMTGGKDLFISDVLHEAWISADEAGTEAAAATAVIMSLTAAPDTPMEFNVDRPFLYVLHDTETGSILFMGRVVDPST
jgi:serpin B